MHKQLVLVQVKNEIFKAKKKKNEVFEMSIWCRHHALQYDVPWSQTDFECLLLGENSIFLVYAAKVRHLKLKDADHEREANQPNLTRALLAIYPTSKEAKEKVARA